MKRQIPLFIAVLFAIMTNAQILNGDLNHNDNLDVGDITLLIDGYLTGEKEVINTEVDHYAVQNSMVAGTWYISKTEILVLNTDGTTNYGNDYTYKFLPSQGRILFFNTDNIPVTSLKVVYIAKDYLAILPAGDDEPIIYTAQPPIQFVTSITLSKTSLELKPDAYERLTVTVKPDDADNKEVIWYSSDETVATVSNGFVLALKDGTAIITVEAADGSGVKATCKVNVVSRVC
ncbi:MAG: Ig domain-containing protein [Bacteroidaceae bacterium]|nr:Ig domain-containing protein [Bacteroidaceae bacterium]